MIADVVLTITILALITYIAVSQYITSKEREKFMKMFIAKSLREVTDNEVLDKMKPPTDTPPTEFVPLDVDNEELFDKHIKQEIEDAKREHEQDEI